MTYSPGTPRYPVTLDEYERMPDDSFRDELVSGRVVREPLPGAEHDRIAQCVFLLLVEHGQRTGKGEVTFGAGYELSGDTVRGPDVAFISRERLPAETPTGWWPFAPDLAVEVLSRSNRVSAMNEKVLNYLEAGTRLVWVNRPAHAHRHGAPFAARGRDPARGRSAEWRARGPRPRHRRRRTLRIAG